MNLDNQLVIGSVAVNLFSLLNGQQSYEWFGGGAVHRKLNGTASSQRNWRKLRTLIRAEGTIPAGLDGVDFDTPQLIKCARFLSQTGEGLAYTLPASRRADSGYTPRGFGYLNRRWQETVVSLASNTATLVAVPGSNAYRVIWYPEFSAISLDGVRTTSELTGGSESWELELEEV